MSRYIERQLETMVVEIAEVNVPENTVIVKDQYGNRITVTRHYGDPLIVVPLKGETWSMKREGLDWVLHKRFNSKLEEENKILSPGDYRLHTDTKLWLEGNDVSIKSATPVDFNDGDVTGIDVLDATTVNATDVNSTTVDATTVTSTNVNSTNVNSTNVTSSNIKVNTAITFPDLTTQITAPIPFSVGSEWPFITRSAVELTVNAGIATNDVLTCNIGTVPVGWTSTYSWRRTDTNAVLGTNQTYTVQAADITGAYQVTCLATYLTTTGTRTHLFETVNLGAIKFTFVYTGGVQTITIPTGVTSLNVKAWAGGGGGGGIDAGQQGGQGGAGGWVRATVPVVAGQTHNVLVGGGGIQGIDDSQNGAGGAGGYNGGGTGGVSGNGGNSGSGAGGGGWSGIYRPDGTTHIVVAGGGGGGTGGAGGAINVWGKGGNNQTSANGTSTTGATGGNLGGGDGGGGGGAGGGRYGGGTVSPGRVDGGGDVTKSDGGLNYVNGTYGTLVTSTTGADNSSAGTQTGDADYAATAGGGGTSGNNGQNGRVVIITG